MIKCMVLNFNQSVSEELYFLWNAISKTYATVRLFTGGQAFTEAQGTFKLLSFALFSRFRVGSGGFREVPVGSGRFRGFRAGSAIYIHPL